MANVEMKLVAYLNSELIIGFNVEVSVDNTVEYWIIGHGMTKLTNSGITNC